jgi:RHS repeat-associated protein
VRYKPFGYQRWSSGTIPTHYQFTGQSFDQDTGLYFYNSRFYDPSLGRFIQPDMIVPEPSNAQALNRYAYVYNNPLNYTDPSGHSALWQGGGSIDGAYGFTPAHAGAIYDMASERGFVRFQSADPVAGVRFAWYAYVRNKQRQLDDVFKGDNRIEFASSPDGVETVIPTSWDEYHSFVAAGDEIVGALLELEAVLGADIVSKFSCNEIIGAIYGKPVLSGGVPGYAPMLRDYLGADTPFRYGGGTINSDTKVVLYTGEGNTRVLHAALMVHHYEGNGGLDSIVVQANSPLKWSGIYFTRASNPFPRGIPKGFIVRTLTLKP